MKSAFVIVLIIGHFVANSQVYTREFTESELAQIEDVSKKVDYIHSNFYKIYSADFDNADSLSQWATQVSQRNNWALREGYANVDHGIIVYLKGEYDKALPYYLRAAQIFDSLDNQEGIGRLNNEFAVFYHKQDQLEQAYACLDKSEQAARAINNLEILGTSLSHRGSFLSRRSKYEEARPFFEEVMDIRIKTKDSVGLGYIYLDFAEYALFKGNLKESLNYVEKSTNIRKKIGDEQGVAVNTVVMGETYFNAGQVKKAIPYFEKTIDLARAIGYTDLLRFTYKQLEKSHLKLNEHQEAYQYQLLSHQLQDSLFNIEKSKVISELQTKYETEKKDLQLAEQEVELQRNYIFLLIAGILIVLIVIVIFLIRSHHRRKQQLLIQQQEIDLNKAQIESALESQEKERSRYAKDLHDGFGQMISILNMNLKGLETESSREKREGIFKSSSTVLNDMYNELRNICFNLMPQALIKAGVDVAIKEFAQRINQVGKHSVEVNIFGFDERLAEIQEITIYRITQEWINNILKHSDADQITIQLTKDHNEITLLVEDNGSGFDVEKLKKGSGNGWKNLHSRSNLISGKIDLDIAPGRKGNTFILNAPLQVKLSKSVAEKQEIPS